MSDAIFYHFLDNYSSLCIYNMKTNGIINPIGYELNNPSLSWIVNSSLTSTLISTKVEISFDPEFKILLYENRDLVSVSSIDFRVNISIKPRTRYYWRVIVKTTVGTITSPTAFFESSKMDEKWEGNWITPSISDSKQKSELPLVRKKFNLNEIPQKARIYITGLGLYELYINGKKASDEIFTPFYTGYDNWFQYQTYDITSLLQKGENVVGVMLGDGWARGRWSFKSFPADISLKTNNKGTPSDIYVDKYILLAELRILFENQEEVIVKTDETWKYSQSEILFTNIYDGEVIDSNIQLKQKGWLHPGFNDDSWKKMEITEKPNTLGKLSARYSPPVVVKHIITPKEIITDKNGDKIINMGQNIAGWVEFSVDEIVPKGFEIILEFGELLNNGTLYRDNLRTAYQQFRYISNGQEKPEKVHPHFTFYGFQYIRLKSWFGKNVNLENFVGLSIYSDLTQTGFLRTSNKDVNKLIQNVLWSQRDNFIDVPTDCPQRDERLGWTGDAQNFCGTALFNTDSYAFFRKFLHDIYEFQKNADEPYVPVFVPFYKKIFQFRRAGVCGWSDSCCIIAWKTYLFTGKKQILEDQIESMKLWVDWITLHSILSEKKKSEWIRTDQKNVNSTKFYIDENTIDDEFRYLWLGSKYDYGDWLSMDGPYDPNTKMGNVRGGTDITFLSSAFYYYSTTLLVKAAKVLELHETADHYSKLAERILKSIRHEFFTKNGRCTVQTQTAQVFSLYFGLAPDDKRETVFANLVKLLTDDGRQQQSVFADDDDDLTSNMRMKTGMLGTPHLCKVLSQFGYQQFAYGIFMNKECPGWLYQVEKGATTTWERWNSIMPSGEINPVSSMNSFNHYWIGSILEWVYSYACGISPMENKPGFVQFNLAPQPSFDKENLGFVEAVFESPMGVIKSAWKLIDIGKVMFNFTVPFNSLAHLRIRNSHLNTLKFVVGNANLKQDGKDIIGDLKSGVYSLTASIDQEDFRLKTKFN